MTKSFQRLRTTAALWLVLQAAAFGALFGVDCCAGHASPAAPTQKCHLTQEHEESRAPLCTLRGTCDGPLAALTNLLAQQAVITDGDSPADLDRVGAPAVSIAPRPLLATLPPDSPPPRS